MLMWILHTRFDIHISLILNELLNSKRVELSSDEIQDFSFSILPEDIK